ncbi:phosphate ABC transporter substrate-binding protein [Methanobacterium sp. MBAC-LM]|jgi:phosphate transport system substrate-binding protein|uniref:phosphate ABC transporter substrate-binding protein n=1 Tax=Methanobacterium sp. MBAC-LM TaxID=3412034 RepID=UPI003C7438B6
MNMNRKYKYGIVIAIIIIIAYLTIIPSSQYERIQIAGSTSVQPVAEALADAYMEKHPNVRINVQGGGSSLGISSVSQGITEIGTSSRDLTPQEKEGLIEYEIGKEGIVIAVNNNNNVTTLSTEQVRGIFNGAITNWDQVGGSNTQIHVVTREEGSGTRSSFENLIMDDTKIRSDAVVQSSTESVKQVVKQDPGAIGFVSLAHMSSDVTALKINGVGPSAQTVANGSYKLQTAFLFVVKGEPQGTVKDFIDFTLSPEGQAIVKSQNIVPVNM